MHLLKGDKAPQHQSYHDNDGNLRNFQYIDHDKKVGGSMYRKESLEDLQESLRLCKEKNALRVLCLPAISVIREPNAELFEEFIKRDPQLGIIWNEEFVKNYCSISDVYSNHVLWNRVWKRTVKQEYWHTELTLEELQSGKWKSMVQSEYGNLI